MIIYSHKDIRVKVNDQNLFCSSLEISRSSSFNSLFTINNIVSNDYYNTDFPIGTIDISYYITGIDEFTDFSNKEKKYKIDFGGSIIHSASLSSYGLSIDENKLLTTNVSLIFYDNISGEFSPLNKADFLPENIDVLKSSEVSISGDIEIHEGLIKNLAYSYKNKFSPNYVLEGGILPYNLSFQEDSVGLNMAVYNYNLNVPPTGQRVSFAINLKNKDYNSLISIPVSALINSKKMGIDVSSVPVVNLELIQANLGNLKQEDFPSISGFYPLSGQIDSTVNLTGNKFKRIERAMLGEFRCDIQRDLSSETNLSLRLPNTLPFGYKAPFTITTLGGMEYFSNSGFFVTSGINL